MSRARDFADLAAAYSGGALANRNMIINGNMAINQRSVNLSIVHDGTSSGYACDRWLVQEVQHDELEGTLEQVAVTDLAGFKNALKWTTTEPESAIAANEAFDICQKIEGQNCQRLAYGLAGAKKATLSFWVKSSVTGTYGVNFYKDDAAGALTAKNFTSTYAISSADTWEKKTVTVPADTGSSGAINDDTGEGLRISWHLGTGSDFTSQDTSSAWTDYTNAGWAYGHAQNGVTTTDNATWFLTGVQFELGEVATPFEDISYGDNLAKCQRYLYVVIPKGIGAASYFGNGWYYDTDKVLGFIHFPVTMRAVPTLEVSNASNDFGIYRAADKDDFDDFILNSANIKGMNISNLSDVSGTAGHAGGLYLNDATNAYLHVMSEI